MNLEKDFNRLERSVNNKKLNRDNIHFKISSSHAKRENTDMTAIHLEKELRSFIF